MKKFIRKHRLGVVAAPLVVLAMLCGMTGIVVGLIEARKQQRIAEHEKEKALVAQHAAETQRDVARKEVLKSHTVIDFLKEMFACASPWEDGRDVKVVDILERAAARIERALEHEPEVEGLLRYEVGKAYFGLGFMDEAMPHVEYAVARLSSIRGEGYEEALKLHRAVLEKRIERNGEDHLLTEYTMNNLASLLIMKERYREAEPFMRMAVKGYRRIHGDEYLQTLLIRNNFARLLLDIGAVEESEAISSDVVAIARRVLPVDNVYIGVVGISHGVALMRLERFGEAEDELLICLAKLKKELGPAYPWTLAVIWNMAEPYRAWGKPEEA